MLGLHVGMIREVRLRLREQERKETDLKLAEAGNFPVDLEH